MKKDVELARIFIGSSAEGLPIARHLQSELEAGGACEVIRWDNDVFAPSNYSLDDLLEVSGRVDFAVLVASPDDVTVSRNETSRSVRDNIVFEFGLFAGALGRQRTYLLATHADDLKLPTDVLGLTRLPFRERADGNLRAALNDAALAVERRFKELGRARPFGAQGLGMAREDRAALEQETELLVGNARAQGWQVKTNSSTTLRLKSPRGVTHTLSKTGPHATREDLRVFAKQLRAAGLRVNSAVRRPVSDSPL